MPAFGRLKAPDARDARYPFRLLLDPLIDQFFPRGLPVGWRHYQQGPVLDQKDTGTCVAHGWSGWAYGAPLMTPVASMPTPYNLYRMIVLNDEWADNDFEATAPDNQLQNGTSVRAGVQTLRKMGHVQNFLWTSSTEDVRAFHLAGLGGVVLGVDWHSGMMRPDKYGVIHVTGAVEGGHCVKTTGWTDLLYTGGKRLQRAVRVLNSWGASWGQQGRAWLLEDDLQKLLDAEGECAAAIEQAVLPLAA